VCPVSDDREPPPVISDISLTAVDYESVCQGSPSFVPCQAHVHLLDRLFTFANVISPKVCRKFIEQLDFSPAEKFVQEQRTSFAKARGAVSVRTNMRRLFVNEAVARVVWHVVRSVLPAKLEDGRTIVGVRSAMNFYRYTAGQYFTNHVDGGSRSSETGHTSEYTFIIYLNENFGGGTTRFCGVEEWEGEVREVKPVQGGMLVLRQRDMKHCGVTVTAGHKYILQGMVMYSALKYNQLGRPIGKAANVFQQVSC